MSLLIPSWAPYVAGAGLVIVLGAGGAYLHHVGYESGRADCEAAHTLADLNEFKAQTNRLSEASNKLSGIADTLATAKPTVIKEYHETVKTALPAGCILDVDRLRGINAAIAATAAPAVKYKPTVSTAPAIQ